MASVASTYARAFADVVLSAHLDAGSSRWWIARDREAAGRECGFAAGLGESGGSRGAEAQAAGCDRAARRHRQAGAEPDRGADRSPAHAVSPRIIEQLEKELDARLGFAEAQISSARELGDAEKRALESQMEKTTGKKVRARYALDSSLLGGAVVRVGSTIYDGSVKGQLERIREAISA